MRFNCTDTHHHTNRMTQKNAARGRYTQRPANALHFDREKMHFTSEFPTSFLRENHARHFNNDIFENRAKTTKYQRINRQKPNACWQYESSTVTDRATAAKGNVCAPKRDNDIPFCVSEKETRSIIRLTLAAPVFA